MKRKNIFSTFFLFARTNWLIERRNGSVKRLADVKQNELKSIAAQLFLFTFFFLFLFRVVISYFMGRQMNQFEHDTVPRSHSISVYFKAQEKRQE